MEEKFRHKELPSLFLSHSGIRWLCVVLLVITAVGCFGWLVWRADAGVARALDTFLLTVLGLAASVAVSVLAGRWSAQRSVYSNFRPFLRAAFRSHGELVLGLHRVVDHVTRASQTLENRLPLAATEALVQEQAQRALEGLEN